MPGVALRGFRNRTKIVAANETVYIDVAGTYFVCLANTGSFQIGIDGSALEDFESGLKARLADGDQFKQIRLLDTSGSSNTIQLAIGFGDFQDARFTASGTLTTLEAKAATLDSITDVSLALTATTLILAADTTRREAMIQNLSGNSQTLRIGDSGAGAANGLELPPGGMLILTTTAEIRGYNPGGSAQSVAVTVIKD